MKEAKEAKEAQRAKRSEGSSAKEAQLSNLRVSSPFSVNPHHLLGFHQHRYSDQQGQLVSEASSQCCSIEMAEAEAVGLREGFP